VRVVSGRVRFLAVLVGLLALAGSFGVQSPRAASIVLSLNPDGTLEVVLGTGTRIRTSTPPGVVIPPGTYAVVVISEVPDAGDGYHMFQLAGPGVNLQTDLLAGDDRAEPHTVRLEPGSAYSFSDVRNPSFGRVVFSTSAAGTEAAASSSGGSSGGSSAGSTSTSKSTANKDAVGSRVVATRGTLEGGVSTTGTPTLLFKGKKVSSLKSGRYTINVLDETSRSPFVLQRLSKQPVTVSPRSFVGRRKVTLTLNAGQWVYYTSPGKKTYFIVVAG
jgi:hypothetical protein